MGCSGGREEDWEGGEEVEAGELHVVLVGFEFEGVMVVVVVFVSFRGAGLYPCLLGVDLCLEPGDGCSVWASVAGES